MISQAQELRWLRPFSELALLAQQLVLMDQRSVEYLSNT
jgi:hypothetical protein